MPTYEYKREDGTTFEVWQRITADPLETCPDTGQPVERLISAGSGMIFKGDGFYVNDYGTESNGSNGSATNGNASATDTSAEANETTDE